MKLFGTVKTEENSLVVGGIKATKLVEQYGTPLYVMDEEFLRNNCREYYSHLNVVVEEIK